MQTDRTRARPARERFLPTQRSRATDHGRSCSDERSGLLARVPRLELMSDGKDQDNVFSGKPTVFRDISVTAAREDEFPPTFFRRLPE